MRDIHLLLTRFMEVSAVAEIFLHLTRELPIEYYSITS